MVPMAKKVHEMTKNVNRASMQGYVSCIGNFVHYNLRSNAEKLLTIEIHRSNIRRYMCISKIFFYSVLINT